MRNVAFIGFGSQAEKVMLPVFADAANCKLTHVAVHSDERVNNFKERFPNLHFVTDYKSLLSDPEIELIYISSANSFHSVQVVDALSAKKHVLVEKPLALTRVEAESISRALTESNHILLECFAYRFHSQHKEAFKALKQRTIGELREINASYCYELPDYSNVRYSKELGGGIINDVACYFFDCLDFYHAPGVELLNVEGHLDTARGVETTAQIALRCKDGVKAKLFCSMEQQRENRLELIGSSGEIHIESAFHMPRRKTPRVTVKAGTTSQRLFIEPMNQFAAMVTSFLARCEEQVKRQTNEEQQQLIRNAQFLEQSREAIRS